MITLAIVAVLAAVALPAYLNYTRRAVYAEVLAQASPVKNALITCFTLERDFAKCGTYGELGIDPPAATKVVDSVSLIPSGSELTIRLVPKDYRGIEAADICDLVPDVRRPTLQSGGGGEPSIAGWSYDPSSPCVTKGYVKN